MFDENISELKYFFNVCLSRKKMHDRFFIELKLDYMSQTILFP